MGHSDEWTFADYFRYEKEIYRAIISAAVLCTVSCHSHTHCSKRLCHQLFHLAGDRIRCHHGRTQQIQCCLYQNSTDSCNGKL